MKSQKISNFSNLCEKQIMKTFFCFATFFMTMMMVALSTSSPEQIHLAFGNDESEMIVSWASNDTKSAFVSYGTRKEDLSLVKNGTTQTYDNLEYCLPISLHYMNQNQVHRRWMARISSSCGIERIGAFLKILLSSKRRV